MDSGVADFGLVKKDLLCEIMTITAGVDLGSLWGTLGFFSFWFSCYHVANEIKRQNTKLITQIFASYMIENQKEKPQEYLKGNPNQPPQLSS